MNIFKSAVAVMILLVATNVFAARATLLSTVDRVLVTTNGQFGNCMAYLNQPLAPLGVDCPDRWVTFSCSGDLVASNEARVMFDTAQIALATGKELRVYVTDNLKHNGYCFATRVDLIR